MGHEDQFRPPSLNVGCLLRKKTFAGMGGKEEDAPFPAIRVAAMKLRDRRSRESWGRAQDLEIDLRQLRQDIGVDITRAKERLVLSEAETSEPTPDIHRRAPRARTDHHSVEPACPGPG